MACSAEVKTLYWSGTWSCARAPRPNRPPTSAQSTTTNRAAEKDRYLRIYKKMYTLALTPSRSDFYNPMKHLREFPGRSMLVGGFASARRGEIGAEIASRVASSQFPERLWRRSSRFSGAPVAAFRPVPERLHGRPGGAPDYAAFRWYARADHHFGDRPDYFRAAEAARARPVPRQEHWRIPKGVQRAQEHVGRGNPHRGT